MMGWPVGGRVVLKSGGSNARPGPQCGLVELQLRAGKAVFLVCLRCGYPRGGPAPRPTWRPPSVRLDDLSHPNQVCGATHACACVGVAKPEVGIRVE